MDDQGGLACTLDLCGHNQTFGRTTDGLTERERAADYISRWRAVPAALDSARTVKRKARCHRERLGCMIGDGRLQGSVLLMTFTVSDDVLGSTRYRELTNTRLTALGARFRRIGYDVRITARERGSRCGRPHHHVVLDLGAGGLSVLLERAATWRGWLSWARSWVPDERAVMPLWTYERWRHSDMKRRRVGRTYDELMLARYLAESWGLGYVDVQEIAAGAGVGYVMTYVQKQAKAGAGVPRGGARVSYSRVASWRWQYGAKPLVYAFKGERRWYDVRPLALRVAMVAAAEAREMARVVHVVADWVRERIVRREIAARSSAGCALYCEWIAVLRGMESKAAYAWRQFWSWTRETAAASSAAPALS